MAEEISLSLSFSMIFAKSKQTGDAVLYSRYDIAWKLLTQSRIVFQIANQTTKIKSGLPFKGR
jgi:hypothetical protein